MKKEEARGVDKRMQHCVLLPSWVSFKNIMATERVSLMEMRKKMLHYFFVTKYE